MKNLTQSSASQTNHLNLPDILVVCRSFLPKEGGIEEYVYNRCLQDPQRIILLAPSYPGDKLFDQKQPFEIHRWPIPNSLLSGILGSILKQILSMVCSFYLAIKLYFRYHYRYIEWGHGYDFPSLLLLSYVLPIRCFIYLHGNDILCPLQHPLSRSLFQWTLNRTQGIVCNSTFTRDYLKAHCSCQTTIYIINPCLRQEKFRVVSPADFGSDHLQRSVARRKIALHQTYNLPEKAVLILSVGRLVKRKGFDRVINHLPALIDLGLDVYYLICGRGPMETTLKSQSQHLGIANRVHFAGYVPDEELANYYIACDLFVMLTFFDQEDSSIEGFGIVYLEAGYFGKPVIASRVGGVTDAVHHNFNGILVDPDSDSEVATALYQLCTDQQLRDRLGSQGRELASRRTSHSILYFHQITAEKN